MRVGCVDIRDHGASLDGVNDDGLAVASAIAAAGSAPVLCPPWASLLIITPVQVMGQAQVRLDFQGANVYQGHATNEPSFLFVDCDDLNIRNLRYVGADTIDTYDTEFNRLNSAEFNHSAVCADRCDSATVSDVAISGRIYGVALSNGSRASVSRVTVTGFGVGSNDHLTNYHQGISLANCDYATVTNSHLRGVGNGIVVGGDSQRIAIDQTVVLDPTDNGVYVSSGDDVTITDTYVKGGNKTGIKVRGDRHQISRAIIKDTGVGVAASGRTLPINGRNGGYGVTIDNVVVEGSDGPGVQFRNYGQTEYYLRDVTANNLTLVDCCRATTDQGALHGTVEHSHLSNIKVRNSGSYGVYLFGRGSSTVLERVTVDGVDVDGVAVTGMRAQSVARSTFRNVKVSGNAGNDAVYLRAATDCDTQNVWCDSGRIREYGDCVGGLWEDCYSFDPAGIYGAGHRPGHTQSYP